MTTRHPKNSLMRSLSLLAVLSLGLACVEYLPIRNGLRDEQIYLDKSKLTNVNPKLGDGATDDGWLMKVTVVKTSSPNPAGDYAFAGMESDTSYVKLRFSEDTLQVLDGRKLQNDEPEDRNDDLATSTERVIMELAGTHVDVKLREGLDGERTNWLEENTEEPWQKRQKFKVDLEKTSLDPFTRMAWYFGDLLHECVRPVSAHTLPGSFEFDEADQHLSWVIESNYQLTVAGGCYDQVTMATGAGTGTIHYRISFYRPGQSTYVPEQIAEKDPVNRKYGAFQVTNQFRDSETGILSARSFIQRWDPKRTDPVVYYFHEGFPEKFKPMFETIKNETNKVLEESGAALRFDFKDYNWDGKNRRFGDLRYSFVVWHQDVDSTRGLLGYGPSSSDPRTGEVISANVNLYYIGQDYYRFLIQDYLERNGGRTIDAGTKWEDVACNEGDTVAPAGDSARLGSGLFKQMAKTMKLPSYESDGLVKRSELVPTPQQSTDDFNKNYTRLLHELRFANPRYNQYVSRPASMPLTEYKERKATEREFRATMGSIISNENPFAGIALDTREGIRKQLEFRDRFQAWRKNRELLQQHENLMTAHRCVYTFDANDAISAISQGARRCVNGKFESDEAYRERVIEDVTFSVAIHEFGHTLSLRHNFYGSADAEHIEPQQVSSSVMDYVKSQEEVGKKRTWGPYDRAALSWIFGTASTRDVQMQKTLLYCTDEHADQSPLCRRHDLGITPAQIVLNAIERYDILYDMRNRRSYRTYWDTSGYEYAIYDATFPIQRMWHLGLFDWGGTGIKDTLKRVDRLEGTFKSDPEYDAIAYDYVNDVDAAIAMTIAFYDAIISQPAASRNYQTEFDPYYGDVLRLGIVIDKLYATFAFVDLQEVFNYNPNVVTYATLYDSPFSNRNRALAMRALDRMLGASYDTFPWFKYTALTTYTAVVNSNLVDTQALKERVAIRRYNTRADFVAEFGEENYAAAVADTNKSGTFELNGDRCDGPTKLPCGAYVYTYLADRGWHLVANKSRNPNSYQFMQDYNQTLLGAASTTEGTFGLKTNIAAHEYFNNPSGY